MNQPATQQSLVNQMPQHVPVQATTFAFTLDESSAMEAGASDYINETGAYVLKIEQALFQPASTGAQGILLRLKTTDDKEKKATVILNYATKEGKPIFGANFINAILYLSGLQGFNWYPQQFGNETIHVAKELEGIEIGMVLEPVGKSKLELRQVFEPVSGVTSTEAKNGEKPEAIQKLLNQLKR